MSSYCPYCGKDIKPSDTFCPECGASIGGEAKQSTNPSSQQVATPTPPMVAPQKRLYRARDDQQIAGVCAGLARYANMDVGIVRLFTILAFFISGGAVLIAYLVAALAIPEEPVNS